MMEKRNVIEDGRTPAEEESGSKEDHVTKRAAYEVGEEIEQQIGLAKGDFNRGKLRSWPV